MRLVSSALAAGLLAGLAALGGCTNSVPLGSCYSNHELSVDVPPTSSPAVEYRVHGCQADLDACPALCTAVLDNANPAGIEQACQVTFDGDTAHVDVGYQLADGPNCPVFAAPTGGGG